MAYQVNIWGVGDPITQEKMNHIEEGIKNAHTSIATIDSNIININSSITSLTSSLSTAAREASEAKSIANTASVGAAAGARAWAQIEGIGVHYDPVTDSLNTNLAQVVIDQINNATSPLSTKITQAESNITSIQTNIGLIQDEVTGARSTLKFNGGNATATSLRQKIDDMDFQINANMGSISNMSTTYNSALTDITGHHHNTLSDRLDSMDTATATVQGEVATARGTYADLDARLDADETSIGNLQTDKVNVSDIVDNLNQTDVNKPLSANQGNVIKQMFGTGVGTTTGTTVAELINTAQSNATSNANTYTDNLLGSGFDTTNTVAARIDAIDNASTGSIAGLDTRISALETEVDMTNANSRIDLVETEITNARTSSVVRTPGANDGDPDTDTTYASLDARLEAIETAAVAAKTDINTIASELAMVDNDTIVNTNTKIDKLEADIQSFATELSMSRDSNGALIDTNTRVDQLAYDISHTATQDDSTTGLTQRVGVIESDLNTATTGLKAKVDSIVSDLDTANTGLKARVTALETTPKSATVVVPASRIVYDNETGDPTIYEDDYNDTVGATNVEITPSEDADYLLENDSGKYYYWKYIDDEWVLISGGVSEGGGTGSSSGIILSALPLASEADENIDYFIGNGTDGYIHYRYIPNEDPNEDGTFIQILPKGLINSLGVASINVTTADAAGDTPAVVTAMSGGILAYAQEDTSHTTNLLNNFTALRYARLKTTYEDDGTTLKKQELIFTDTTGTDMEPIEIKGGGVGGTAYSLRLIDMLSATSFMAPASSDATTMVTVKPIVNYGNTLAEGVTITGAVQYKLSTEDDNAYRNAEVTIPAITNNQPFNINVSSLLGEANTTTDIKVTVTTTPEVDGDTYTKSVIYHITTVVMELESVGFDQAAIRSGTSFDFNYRCKGFGLSKTMTFIIDNGTPVTEDIGTSHNETLTKSITLTGLQDGMHSIRAYYTVGSATSNELNYYFIYNSNSSRVTPIVAIAGASSKIHYGEDLTINYTVYTPGQETTEEVEIEIFTKDGNTEIPVSSFSQANVPNSTVIPFIVPEYPLNTNQYTIYARITGKKTTTVTDSQTQETSTVVLTDTQETSIIILPASFDFELKYADPQNRNLLFAYNVAGKSNNDVNKETYTYQYSPKDGNDPFNFTAQFNNFNWSTNGYIADRTTGENALVISGGANCAIDVPIFSRTYSYTPEGASSPITVNIEADPSKNSINLNGRTIEIDYEVVSTVDANSTIIDCMGSNGAGFKVTPQSCYLVSSTTPANISEDSSGFINNESSIAAAYLSTGQRIHLAFVIEPEAQTESAVGGYHQCVNIYVNGEFANSQPYSKGTVFSSAATMTIGNATSLIKLYGIRMYNRGFSDKEVLQNYMMAPSKINDKLARFEENNVLDNETGLVDYTKAIKKYNCLLLTGTMSPYKGSPSTVRFDGVDGQGNPVPVQKRESGLILTKPNALEDIGYTVEFNLMKKSSADHAYLSSNNVQGTSSQKYPIHNLKVYLVDANEQENEADNFVINEQTGEKEYIKSTKLKYKLNGPNSIGESTLCWKADYMSTDHANTYNANLANGLFSTKLPSQDPAQGGDSKVQNTVKGIRCLLFIRADENSTPVFVGDGCLNNDKGNNKTFGLEYSNKTNPELSDNGNDTLRQKWEFTNNSEGLCLFKSDHLYEMITSGEGANQTTSIRAKGGFESTYPDEGDLEDEGLEPNYTHLQILLTWVCQRANFWDASTTEETVEIDGQTVGAYQYNGNRYTTEATYRKAIFLNEFNRHFVLNHVLTYYVFSEFIALCDNRAKNMFLRSDDVRSEVIKLASDPTQIIIDGNSFGNDDDTLWNTIVNHTTGVVNADAIDWENSTFAVWAPVLYDLDSCYGVENVGYLTIPYDADWYYNLKGLAKSQLTKALIDNPVINDNEQISFQFSGVASRLWLMVEDAFASNIKSLAQTLYSRDDGLNYYNIYTNQIEDNLIETSPALVNQDMILKFQNPWETGFIDYSQKPPVQSTEVYKYLQRGTKSSQKDSFVYRRATLLSSLYQADSFIKGSINFRTNISIPGNQLERTGITIKANQMIYPAVTYGDNKAPISSSVKVAANTPYTFYATAEVGATDTIHIAGGAVLTDVGDLSKWSPYEVKVGLGANLKNLILGNKAAGYENLKLDRLDLSNCQLLEVINVENCKALEELDVSGNGLIKEIYTFASNVKRVTVPNGGVLTRLHLGSKVTSINIQNQSYLTEFRYEGDDDQNITNPYSAVNTLWIENTPNVPVVDIITKNAANLTGGVRLNNINVNLGDDSTFLQILVNEELMKGKYINSSGEIDATQYPYITGQVTIRTIRKSLFDRLKVLYPNLTVNVTVETITEYTIEYRDYDGTLLFTDHKTGQENYIDPVVDTDPLTGNPYISWRTRPSSAKFNYYFGLYNNVEQIPANFVKANYTKFSGWLKTTTNSDPAYLTNQQVEGNTTLTASYRTTEVRKYTVKWFAETTDEEPIKSYNVEYGTRISDYTWPDEDGTLTRAKLVNDSYYKVFTGWSQPVGVLTHDTNIYAQWKTSTINNATTSVDFSTLNGADLYALSRIGSGARTTILQSHLGNDVITIPLGHDFNYTEGVTTQNLLGGSSKLTFTGDIADVVVFDGTNGRSEIRPFQKVLNPDTNELEYQDFTLALDYKFIHTAAINSNYSSEYVLASCYKQTSSATNTIQGFKVVLMNTDSNVRPLVVTWGSGTTEDTYTIIDYIEINTDSTTNSVQYSHGYRNMVVLSFSHEDPTKLNVYCPAPSNTPSVYGSEMKAVTLTWTAPIMDTPLILGGNYNYAATPTAIENSSTRRPAGGIIYWGKFWNADIGGTNCNKLASWPHEQLHLYLSGYNSDNSRETSKLVLNNTNLTFVCAESVGDRKFQANTVSFDGAYSSWSNSSVRTFFNERVYAGFPAEYQSIILHASITSNSSEVQTFQNTSTRITYTSSNYLFPPARRELGPGELSTAMSLEANRTWPWLADTATLSATGMVYGIASGYTNTLEVKTTVSDVNPFRYRFSGYYITPNTKIFRMANNPYNNGNNWTVRNANPIRLAAGDIWDTGTAVYVYVSAADVANGVKIDLTEAVGGWKAADAWQLRTYTESQDTGNIWRYWYQIDSVGQVIDGATVTSSTYGTYKGIVFEFAV